MVNRGDVAELIKLEHLTLYHNLIKFAGSRRCGLKLSSEPMT